MIVGGFYSENVMRETRGKGAVYNSNLDRK